MAIQIYTDGACSGNPGKGGYSAHLIFEHNDGRKIHELGGAAQRTTNNRMELAGAIIALEYLRQLSEQTDSDLFLKHGEIHLYTDSRYVLEGITNWLTDWKKRGWMTKAKKPVLNQDLWQILDSLNENFQVNWKKVAGHSGDVGNDRADAIAVDFSQKGESNLKKEMPPMSLSQPVLKAAAKEVEESKAENGSPAQLSIDLGDYPQYISLIDGALYRDRTWAECEARVKGVSGAMYKKVSSEKQEADFLAKHGITA